MNAGALAVDDVIKFRRIAETIPVQLSADGARIAYTLISGAKALPLSRSDIRLYPATLGGVPAYANGGELWVVDIDTGHSQDLSGSTGVSWGGAWSSDGRLLAFYSDRGGAPQLWVWDSATRQAWRPVQARVLAHHGVDLPAWTPDGRGVVVKLAPETPQDAQAADASTDSRSAAVRPATIEVFRSDDPQGPALDSSAGGLAAEYVADLGFIDVRTGAVRRLVRRRPIGAYLMSPCGGRVAFTIVQGYGHGAAQGSAADIAVVSLATGATRVLETAVPMMLTSALMAWSPKGDALVYAASRTGGGRAGNWFLVPVSGGVRRTLSPGQHRSLGNRNRSPLWSQSGEHVFLTGSDTVWRVSLTTGTSLAVAVPQGRRIRSLIPQGAGNEAWSTPGENAVYAITVDSSTGRRGIARLDLATARATLVYEDDVAGHFDQAERLGMHAVGSTVVLALQRSDASPDLWVSTDNFNRIRQLTHINPELERYQFGRSQLVTWLSLDGEVLKGALLLPAGYIPGRRYPLIVCVYGGSHLSRDVNRFGLAPHVINAQLFSTRGYAVLAPDAPSDATAPMWSIAKAVLPGVNKVIELGIADPRRVGVLGASYGGYSTLGLLVQTTRFRAAASISGMASLFTQYGQLSSDGFAFGVEWAEGGQGGMLASPWERRDRYIENSPYFFLDRVTTPLLLIHGTHDSGVPVFASDEVFTSLRRLGKSVTYVRYQGASHLLTAMPTAEQRDYYSRLLEWFQTHLEPS